MLSSTSNDAFRIPQHGRKLNGGMLRSCVTRCKASTMSVNTHWFKSLMADRNVSQRELAKRIGIDHSALSLALRGKRQMKMVEAAGIARLLGVPVAEVMENAGIQADTRTVPLRGYVDGHSEMHTEESDERVPSPHAMPLGSFALQCRTASSPIDHMDGWMLFVQRPIDSIPADTIGRFCLCRLANGMQIVGTLRRGYKRGRFNIVTASSQFNDVELEWASPITHIET